MMGPVLEIPLHSSVEIYPLHSLYSYFILTWLSRARSQQAEDDHAEQRSRLQMQSLSGGAAAGAALRNTGHIE